MHLSMKGYNTAFHVLQLSLMKEVACVLVSGNKERERSNRRNQSNTEIEILTEREILCKTGDRCAIII